MKIDSLEKDLTKFYRLHSGAVQSEKWFCNMYIKKYNEKLNKLYRSLCFYKHKPTTEAKGYDFDLIRAIPIKDLLGEPVMASHNRAKYLCPLHNEKKPSFNWYKDTNSWYCFGCAKGGSVIDLVMAMDGCDATEAIKKLSYYV